MGALSGKRILITRAAGQAAAVSEDVQQRGGIPLLFPCLEVQALPDAILRGITHLKTEATQVLFSSANGVRCVADVLGNDFITTFCNVLVVAVGKHTADALHGYGINPAWMPKEASQEGLISAWKVHQLPESLVFFRAEEGRALLPDTLSQLGVAIHLIPAYRTICPQDDPADIIHMLASGKVDGVLLGSSKTTRYYVQRVSDIHLANTPVIVAISQKVANTGRKLGLNVQIIAKEASFASMLDALACNCLSPS